MKKTLIKTKPQSLNRLKKTCVTLTLITSTASLAQAQWLQHTTATPGTSTNAAFAGVASGAYLGNVRTTASSIVDGGAVSGVPGITPQNLTAALLTSDFTNNYPVNSNGNFEYITAGYNDTGDTFTVTMDFKALTLGYLPGNTIIAFLDIDSTERLTNMRALDSSGNPITSPWLNPITGSPNAAPGVFDYSNLFGLPYSNATNATYSSTGGVYSFLGTAGNYDSAFQGFTTGQGISIITFDMSLNTSLRAGGGGAGVAITSVPEPSTFGLVMVAGMGWLLASRRRSLVK